MYLLREMSGSHGHDCKDYLWRCIVWCTVTNVSEKRATFVFRAEEQVSPKRWHLCIYHTTQCYIPDDGKLHIMIL
jgi:hypothetical protein